MSRKNRNRKNTKQNKFLFEHHCATSNGKCPHWIGIYPIRWRKYGQRSKHAWYALLPNKPKPHRFESLYIRDGIVKLTTENSTTNNKNGCNRNDSNRDQFFRVDGKLVHWGAENGIMLINYEREKSPGTAVLVRRQIELRHETKME